MLISKDCILIPFLVHLSMPLWNEMKLMNSISYSFYLFSSPNIWNIRHFENARPPSIVDEKQKKKGRIIENLKKKKKHTHNSTGLRNCIFSSLFEKCIAFIAFCIAQLASTLAIDIIHVVLDHWREFEVRMSWLASVAAPNAVI